MQANLQPTVTSQGTNYPPRNHPVLKERVLILEEEELDGLEKLVRGKKYGGLPLVNEWSLNYPEVYIVELKQEEHGLERAKGQDVFAEYILNTTGTYRDKEGAMKLKGEWKFRRAYIRRDREIPAHLRQAPASGKSK